MYAVLTLVCCDLTGAMQSCQAFPASDQLGNGKKTGGQLER